MKKNFVICTAGHVDHGKTSLIKALTGKDCDTHPEEKSRGITIHLGFSHFALSPDMTVGIVDVPGHKDFIDTMISGINGIDLVLFIVSADECFMPQTVEHLHILDILGVKRGLVVLTKCDLVDEETLHYAREEIREQVMGTFLSEAQIVETSAMTGKNIDTLHQSIFQMLSDVSHTKLSHVEKPFFRYFPDRFFSIKGHGSVVTGTVLRGSLSKNQVLYGIGKGQEYKIRKLEAYSIESDSIHEGQRASINITNFAKEDFYKGLMLSDQLYATTDLIDVELQLLSGVKPLGLRSTVEFYAGTIAVQARVHLMDTDTLYAGGRCFAQLHLQKPHPLCYHDMFIIRNSSGDTTLGGGRVIDAFPLHHRRRTQKVLTMLQLRASVNLVDVITTEIDKSNQPVSIDDIYDKLRVDLASVDLSLLPLRYTQYGDWFWVASEQEKLEGRLIRYLSVAHKNNPLDSHGKCIDDFTSLIASFPEPVRVLIVSRVVQSLLEKKQIDKRADTFALSTHKVVLSQKEHVMINWVDQFLSNQKMKTPLWSELSEKCARHDINEKRLKQILFYLVSKKRVVHHDGEYIHTTVVNPVRVILLRHLLAHPQGCTVSEFRDLIGGNRKICVILLNIYDAEGVIVRRDDYRFITEKGKKLL
jgi:selenocysteine-specific elongation factor